MDKTFGNLGANINAGLWQGYSQGGSTNSAHSVSQSQTNGTAASMLSNQFAQQANNSALSNWMTMAQFNSEEAAAQRAWLEKMANSTYQRTVEDMKKAGINPILAAQAGLAADSVSGAAAASASSPSTFMANAMPDSMSSSASEEYGSSWNKSEQGVLTFLNGMSKMVEGILGQMNSSNTINIALDFLKDMPDNAKEGIEKVVEKVSEGTKDTVGKLQSGWKSWLKDQAKTGNYGKLVR